jgi:gluconate 2-dehydrogenase gamma chain
MSEIDRRAALVRLAAAFAGAGLIDAATGRNLHAEVRQARATGAYNPVALTSEQFRVLERLADLIIPTDGQKPGALATDVPAWIDTLLNVNRDLLSRYKAGLAWLDSTMQLRHGLGFVAAAPQQQAALLDLIAYQKNRTADLNAGIDFFILARRMTVDGFYTSPVGMKDLYPGNTPQTDFKVPQEAYDYVLSRSPLK